MRPRLPPSSSALGATATPPAPVQPPLAEQPIATPAPTTRTRRWRPRARWASARHAGLPVAVAMAGFVYTYRLAQNGYANIFYSAGVKSMLRSWHNFLFASFDPGGLITIDKPPLALWAQVASAKLFGFSAMSLLLPEAIIGVLTVALLYVIVARRFGPLAAFAAALALIAFPSFAAVSRDNGVDPLLILLMLLACATGLRAAETGRLRALLASAAFVGLAFNAKTLAAYLVVPSIALAYLVCAPGRLPRRLGHLLVAGLVMLAVSFAWIAFVELTPASQRPFVGGSTNNTELGLTFQYNGLGRVEGEVGGPGQIISRPGGYVPIRHPHPHPPPPRPGSLGPNGRELQAVPFGPSPKVLRLFGRGLGDQDGWMLPFAVFGLLALALLTWVDRRAAVRPAKPDRAHRQRRGRLARLRRDPRLASLRRDQRLAGGIVLGGWFLVEAVVLSLSKGIIHPYYVSALAPGTAAMAGAGALAFARLASRPRRMWGLLLALCAVIATVAVELRLIHREDYLLWFAPVLVVGAIIGLCALVAHRRLATPAVALMFVLLLIAPTAYGTTSWLAPVVGTFPAAGPRREAGTGGYGEDQRNVNIDLALIHYVRTHHPGRRWAVLTVASDTASPLILLGLDAGSVAGYSGTDPAVNGPRLARLVASGQARYVLLGGAYSQRGGNAATKAVLRACRELSSRVWHSPVPYPYGIVLFDCAGHERGLAAS